MTDLTEEMLQQRASMARERYRQRGTVEANYRPLLGYDWFLTPFNMVCVVPFGRRVTAVTASPRRRNGTFFQWEQIILPEVR